MKMKKFDPDMESVRRLVMENIRDADRILGDVPPEKSFWVNDGMLVRSIQDLPKVLEEMDDEIFKYHVNEEKNDFVKWIDEVIRDKELANSLRNVRKKDSMIRRIRGRIEYLKNISGRG
jgi:hypothetical protein